jgi:superfamily II DNA helicase RecQ
MASLLVSEYTCIRSTTPRPEISYRVHRVKSLNDAIQAIKQDTQKVLEYTGKERALIFCKTVGDGEKMASAVNSYCYHASLPEDRKLKIFNAFLEGNIHIGVATSSWSVGLDLPSIRDVYHLGFPRNFLEFYQVAGRAARDGLISICNVYYTDDDNVIEIIENEDDPYGAILVQRWCKDSTQCRREVPSLFLDGIAYKCSDFPNAALCDVCECHNQVESHKENKETNGSYE